MRKIAAILLVITTLFAFSGCKKDSAGDQVDDRVVATVNGVEIKRGEVEELLIGQMGMYMQFMDADTLKGYREQCLEILIQQEAARQKAKEMGLDQLTEEETKKVEENYKASYDNAIQYFTEELQQEDKDSGMFEEAIQAKDYSKAAEEKYIAYLEENQKYSLQKFPGETVLQQYHNLIRDMHVINIKLHGEVTKEVDVEEDAVKKEYDSLLKQQKESYDQDVLAYEKDYNSNVQSMITNGYIEKAITYVPEGLRYVKHILISFPAETKSNLQTLFQAYDTALTSMKSAEDAQKAKETAVKDAADDAKRKTAEEELAEAKTAFQDAKEKHDKAKQAYDEAMRTAKEKLKDKVTPVYEKVKAGEDFAALMQAHSEDPGMNFDEYKNKGYLMSDKTEGLMKEFKEAAMALKKVGDKTEPVYTYAGGHIIEFTSVTEKREIPYAEVKEDIKDILLSEAKQEKFIALLKEWGEAAEIVKDADALTASDSTEAPAAT